MENNLRLRVDHVWIYHLKNKPIFEKNIIIPDALRRAKATEEFPQILLRSVCGSGFLEDILITFEPIKYLKTDLFRPISLEGSKCWVLSTNPRNEFRIKLGQFQENAGDYTFYGGVAFINSNTAFIRDILLDHSELLSYFIRICFSSNGFKRITSTINYNYMDALFIEREILRQPI